MSLWYPNNLDEGYDEYEEQTTLDEFHIPHPRLNKKRVAALTALGLAGLGSAGLYKAYNNAYVFDKGMSGFTRKAELKRLRNIRKQRNIAFKDKKYASNVHYIMDKDATGKRSFNGITYDARKVGPDETKHRVIDL